MSLLKLCNVFLFFGCAYVALGSVIIDTSSEYEHPEEDEPYTASEAAESLLDPSHIGDLLPSLKAPFKDDPICNSDADIGFILDSSRSIWRHYNKEKIFLTSLVEAFGLGRTKSRASVITFSYYTVLSIKFNDYFDFNIFKAAVDKIPLMSSVTFMDRALRQAQREMFTAANGARANKPKVLVLLTDGEQSTDQGPYEDPALVVRELRQQGVNVLVVGMGGRIKQKTIKNIAGSKDKAFKVKGFKKLISPEFIGQMKTKTCEAVKEAEEQLKEPDCPENGVDYRGGDIKLELDVTSWQDCARRCSSFGTCEVFTYVKKTGCCYLKNGTGTNETTTGLISGGKACVDTFYI